MADVVARHDQAGRVIPMSYVPIVTPPPQAASPRVRELSEELSRVITDYARRYPDLSRREIADAARLAQQGSGAAFPAPQAVALALGVAAFLGAGLLYMVRDGAGFDLLVWLIGLVVVGTGVAFAVRLKRRE